jgi:hypothetical protein
MPLRRETQRVPPSSWTLRRWHLDWRIAERRYRHDRRKKIVTRKCIQFRPQNIFSQWKIQIFQPCHFLFITCVDPNLVDEMQILFLAPLR